MHQPDYRDAEGIIQMPWVFLHAIKDYYDMPWMMARHEGIKATFNITSPLIQQLELYYTQAHEKDKFFSLWLRDPSFLNEEERSWIIKLCKSAQYETMVAGLSRYEELYNQDHFDNSELIDLEMLFVLAWCGVYLREKNGVVKRLMLKGREYSFEDKQVLLQELSGFVSGIFGYYKELHSRGVISISTTPLNHPILPLLLDMQNAVYANPNTNIPKDYMVLEEDAKLQVQRAQELFLETFGFEVQGFWPAEGGVDNKAIELLRSCGVKWIATDEDILFKSLSSNDRENLYFPYIYNDMTIAFRDHRLSDLLGFTYRHKQACDAAKDFLHELQHINNANPHAIVSVILDGENAWEFYKNNGFDFFDALYKEIKNTPWCDTITMDEVYTLPKRDLHAIAPGSWIHGAFNTWVGHREKTRAWELIYMTKRDYERHETNLEESVKEEITHHFLAAECSDWFWWYGDDHYTEFGAEFDELFRSHLIKIYNLIGITAPSDMFVSIIKDRSTQHFWLQPQSNISPLINGKHDSFFEWIGCGVVDEGKLFSTMDMQRGPISRILYGQDEEKLYFAFEAKIQQLCSADSMIILIDPLNIRGKLEFETKKAFLGNLEVEVACGNWLEISIEKKNIEEQNIAIRFEIEDEGSVIQTLPGFGELKIDLKDDYSHNWFV